MKLTNMKRKPPKKNKNGTDEPTLAYGDEGGYPWGLRISLHKEDLSRLGIKASDFTIEQKATVVAQVEVISLDKEDRVEFQITSMAIEKQKDDRAINTGFFSSGKVGK